VFYTIINWPLAIFNPACCGLSAANLIKPGGSRAVIAENLLLKQQLKLSRHQLFRFHNAKTRG
jgi:hypothetical protein